VRHLAWLHVVPEGEKEQRAKQLDPQDSRLKLPDHAQGAYLIEMLSQIGFARQGPAPIDYQEIAAWCSLTDTDLTPWEADTLHKLSESYVVQLHRSKDANAEPPYDVRTLDEMRERSSSQFQRLFKQAGGGAKRG
jgi:hypothetical protein